jgi:hypothetical protein
MQRKLVGLIAVLALMLVAVVGMSAAGDAGNFVALQPETATPDGTTTPDATDTTTTPDATGTVDTTTTPDATGTVDTTTTPEGTGTPAATETTAATATVATGPGDFGLLEPANNTTFRRITDFVAISWQVSAGADVYNLIVFKLSNNTRIGEVINTLIQADACDTTAGVCTLPLTSSEHMLLTDGQYAWTVVAINNDGDTEASNAPFLFTVNTAPILLVVNGGFESKDEDGDPDLLPWEGKNVTGDKIKCNKDSDGDGTIDKIFAFSGECAFQFKGGVGENSKIQQNLDATQVFAGDTLTFSAYINTKITGAGNVALLKLKYSDPTAGEGGKGKDKLQLAVDTPTANDTYQFFSNTILVDDNVTKAKVILRNRSTSGKLFFDDVQVIGTADAPPIPTATPTTEVTAGTPDATATTDLTITPDATGTVDTTTTPDATATTDLTITPDLTVTPGATGTTALVPLP